MNDRSVSIGGSMNGGMINTGDYTPLKDIASRLNRLKELNRGGPSRKEGLDAALRVIERVVNPHGLGIQWDGDMYVLYSFESRKD